MKREDPDGQREKTIDKLDVIGTYFLINQVVFFRLSGIYETLVPLTKWCGGMFKSIIGTRKPPPRMPACWTGNEGVARSRLTVAVGIAYQIQAEV